MTEEEAFKPGDRVRDKQDGERGIYEGVSGRGVNPQAVVDFDRSGLCRIPFRRLAHDNAKQEA